MKIWSGVKFSPAIQSFSPQIAQQNNEQQSEKRDSVMISDEARARLDGWREREEQLKEAAQKQVDTETIRTTSLLASAQSLEQISALKQVKVPIENDHRRLKTEMKNDMWRGTFLESEAKKIQDLAERMGKIDGELSNQIRKAQVAADDMRTKNNEVEQQEESIEELITE